VDDAFLILTLWFLLVAPPSATKVALKHSRNANTKVLEAELSVLKYYWNHTEVL